MTADHTRARRSSSSIGGEEDHVQISPTAAQGISGLELINSSTSSNGSTAVIGGALSVTGGLRKPPVSISGGGLRLPIEMVEGPDEVSAKVNSGVMERVPEIEMKLFVGRVPRSVNESQLKELFSLFGHVTDVMIMKDKGSSSHKGAAFVRLSSIAHADAAIRALNNNWCLDPSLGPLQVRYAVGEPEKLNMPVEAAPPGVNSAKLFVGSLPKNTTEQEVRRLFEPLGTIDEVYIMRDLATNQGKGCAFVKMAYKEQAHLAVSRLDGKQILAHATRPLEVRFAETKKQQPSHHSKDTTATNAGGTVNTNNSAAASSNSANLQHAPVAPYHPTNLPGNSGYVLPQHVNGSNSAASPRGHHGKASSVSHTAGATVGTSGGSPALVDPSSSAVEAPQFNQQTQRRRQFANTISYNTSGHQHQGDAGDGGSGEGGGHRDDHRHNHSQTTHYQFGGVGTNNLNSTNAVYQHLQQPHGQAYGNQGQHRSQPTQTALASTALSQTYMSYPVVTANSSPNRFGGAMNCQELDSEGNGAAPMTVTSSLSPGTGGTGCTTNNQRNTAGNAATCDEAESSITTAALGTNENPRCAGPWKEYFTEDARPYFYNENTSVTQWDRPAEFDRLERKYCSGNAARNKQSTNGGNAYNANSSNHRVQHNHNGEKGGGSGGGNNNANQEDTAGPLGANIFVFHVPNDWTRDNLIEIFHPYGNIISARIATDKVSQRNKGYAFVSFDNVQSAVNAVQNIHGYQAAPNKKLKVAIKQNEQAHVAHILDTNIPLTSPKQQNYQQSLSSI